LVLIGWSEPCKLPSRRIGLPNDDEADALSWTKPERLARAENAIAVLGFDGSRRSSITRDQSILISRAFDLICISR
jgi:hypothetical protein